jgi:hypothetical protein
MTLSRPFAARLRPVVLAASALALAAACNDEPTVPRNLPSLGPLTVTTQSNKDTLVTGDTAIITFRFTNPSDTTLTFRSGSTDPNNGIPCPALLPVSARPTVQTVNAFILAPCFGGTDSTLSHELGTQTVVVPARTTIELEIPFTGISRASATAAPRCLAVGETWILPLFFLGGQLLVPSGTRDVDGPSLLFLKAPTATPAPCTA